LNNKSDKEQIEPVEKEDDVEEPLPELPQEEDVWGENTILEEISYLDDDQPAEPEPPEVVAPTQIEEIQEIQEIDFNEDFNPSAPAGKPESRAGSALSTEPIQTIELEEDADLHRQFSDIIDKDDSFDQTRSNQSRDDLVSDDDIQPIGVIEEQCIDIDNADELNAMADGQSETQDTKLSDMTQNTSID
jgi:hypothetical protein